ncbi:hypothetical protein A4X13_0g8086 [Tilletia indica]|uniref:Uncharacterized protein n=1 Tax=Tilletia indica TaxID=43049 RepID=A0A8T8SH06_9BASI|nr:hypothetical protein A4X13_0g8086 [Tilletia indica]
MVDDSVAAELASAASLVAASAQPGTLAVGGRGVKRRADGVVYTRENKLIAVYYMFGSSTSRALNVGDRAKRLKVNRPTLYERRKEFPEAWHFLPQDLSLPSSSRASDFIMFWKGLDRLRSTRTSTSIDTPSPTNASTVLNSSSTASVPPTPPVPPEVFASSSSPSAAAALVTEPSGTAFRNAVIVTEQKLVTYLK